MAKKFYHTISTCYGCPYKITQDKTKVYCLKLKRIHDFRVPTGKKDPFYDSLPIPEDCPLEDA